MIYDSKNNNRFIVAARAAEIIMEEGITDYLFAKKKAAKSMGLLTRDNLPSNNEIDNALKNYQNIFQEQIDLGIIKKIKKEALNTMLLFKDFNPHLTGQLLEGLIPKFPKIQINLFTDNIKEVEYVEYPVLKYNLFERTCIQLRYMHFSIWDSIILSLSNFFQELRIIEVGLGRVQTQQEQLKIP